RLRAVLARYGLAGRPFILAVGTLEPRKNLCRLIEAFHRLKREDLYLDHRLVPAGGEGGERDYVGGGFWEGTRAPVGVRGRVVGLRFVRRPPRPAERRGPAGASVPVRRLRPAALRGNVLRHPGGGRPQRLVTGSRWRRRPPR